MTDRAMRLALLVPDGMGLRNFLLTSVLDQLEAHDDAVVWHALPTAAADATAPVREGRVRAAPLPPYREGLASRVLRQAKIYAQLYRHRHTDAADVMLGFRRPRGRWQNHVVARSAQLLGRLAAGDGGARLHAWHAGAVRREALAEFTAWLATERPDVVLCTHQRASRAVPAMMAARLAGIPTVTFVYSWDNLPKGRMAVHADHVLVWSETMRDELRRYEPERDPRTIHVVGTPQFDPYFDPSLRQTREAFLGGLGLDPTRSVVCFSGDDRATSPYDPRYLDDLATALAAVAPQARPQILFRPCPVDDVARYAEVLERHPEIVVSVPAWRAVGDDWTGVLPTAEDQALLANVVAHCDTVVNIGSTMAMDFAILGKPAVFLAYERPEGDTAPWRVGDLYRLPHFRTVHEGQPVAWARDRESLGPAVLGALTNPEDGDAARQAWIDAIVLRPLDAAGERIFATVRDVARGGSA